MLNSILLLSALPPEYINNYINDLSKCSISGVVKKVQIIKYHDCFDKVYIFIKWDLWYFKVNTSLSTSIECVWGSNDLFTKKTLLNTWDKVDFLISKKDKYIISNKNLWGYSYIIETWTIIEENNICLPNSNFIEFHKDYFIIWTWIISLIILGLVIYKKFKK